MARSKARNRGGWSEIDKITDDSQIVTYNGREVTKAQKRALKAAETRRKNAELRKQRDTYTRECILPSVLEHIESTRKSVRCLKTIWSFYENGYRQWGTIFNQMLEFYPKLNGALVRYHSKYNEILDTQTELEKMIKRNKCNKSFFGLARTFGYQMFSLVDIISELSDAICKERITDSPLYSDHEMIVGAKDGRRKGLIHIVSNTFSMVSTTTKNLVELSKMLDEAYDNVVEYTTNGYRVR